MTVFAEARELGLLATTCWVLCAGSLVTTGPLLSAEPGH